MTSIATEVLEITYGNTSETTELSAGSILLTHTYEAGAEGVAMIITPEPPAGTWVRIVRRVGGLGGPGWYCGSGTEYYQSSVRPGMEPLTEAGLQIAVGPTREMDEDNNVPRTGSYGSFGIACNRFGDLAERQPQGLVYVMPATLELTLESDGRADLTRNEKLDLPDSWKLVGSSSTFNITEFGDVSKTQGAGRTSMSRTKDEVQDDGAFRVAGLHVVEDEQAAKAIERLAWLSALIAGGGIGLLTAAVGARTSVSPDPESGARQYENERSPRGSPPIPRLSRRRHVVSLSWALLAAVGVLIGRALKR